MSRSNLNSEKKSSIAVIFIAILEKILGFCKQVVFAAFFGASAGTDVYYLAQTIFSIFNSCYNTSIPISTLSVFIHSGVQHQGETKKRFFINNAISAMLFISALLSVLVFFLSHCFEFLPLEKFASTSLSDLKTYIQILAVMIFAYTLSGMCGSGLECLKFYTPNKCAALFVSSTSIIGVFLFGRSHGIIAAIYSALVGILLHALFVTVLLRNKLNFQLIRPRKTEHIRKVLLLSFPIMLGTAINSINSLVDKCIALNLGPCMASALTYASLVAIELVTAILVTAVSSIMIARFAHNVRTNDYTSLNENINIILSLMMFAVIPIIVIFLSQSEAIMTIIFKRGAFDKTAVDLSSQAFTAYTLALFFIPAREVLVRVQYAYQNSKSPLLNSAASIAINIILSLIFSHLFGIFGIACATSISIMLNTLFNYISVRKKFNLQLTKFKSNVFTYFIAGVISGGVCYAIQKHINVTVYIDFFVICATYALLYSLTLLIINKKSITSIIELLR